MSGERAAGARRARALRCAALGAAIAAAQVALVVWLAGTESLADIGRDLSRWDTGWYAHIAEYGYRSVIPPRPQDAWRSNVAFFPGYPLAIRAVRATLGTSVATSAVLVAHLACWAFWSLFLWALARWRVPAGLAALAVVAVAAHPASFYLAVGYAESLFLAALLGFVLFARSRSPASLAASAACGVVMTGTRLFGVPIAAEPLLVAALRPRFGWRHVARALALGAIALSGALAFFAWCELIWGRWDLYFWTQRVGWNAATDLAAPFRWSTYAGPPGARTHDRLAVQAAAGALAALVAIDAARALLLRDRGWRSRAGLYWCAATIIFLATAAFASKQLSSCARYAFGAHAALALATAHMVRPWWRASAAFRVAATAAALGAAGAAAPLLGRCAALFLRNFWVG